MLVEPPVLLPPVKNLLESPKGLPHPLLETNSLMLAAWKVSVREADSLDKEPGGERCTVRQASDVEISYAVSLERSIQGFRIELLEGVPDAGQGDGNLV